MSKKEIIEKITEAMEKYRERGLIADVFFWRDIRGRIEAELEDKREVKE